MKLVSGIVDSGFFAQSALSAEVATKDSLGRNISETYLTGVDLTPYQTTADMVNYQTTAGMTAYQEAGEYYSASNPSGFLVADDITGKLDASVYAADSGSFLTAVPDTYLQNTDLSTEDGKVTAISGIPLSAGGDVPEGVMVESGLEYNAVNEISAYNGSAIAQYGAEKQFIVHDDTLCHLSNSAQFALGVNLSAVAQLLGVDRTLLWSASTPTSAAELSESMYNFETLKFYFNLSDTARPNPVIETQPNTTMTVGWGQGQMGTYFTIAGISASDNTHIKVYGAKSVAMGNINSTAAAPVTAVTGAAHQNTLVKIYGIGRKQ